MKNFTRLMLLGTMLFSCLGGVNAKLSLGLPGTWSGTTKDGSTYTFGANYKGAAVGGGDWSSSDYEYVWVKYTDYSGGPLNLKVEYDEWKSHQSWGDSFDQQSVAFSDASGVLSIAIDKTTTFVKGSAETDGDHIGEIYAKHIRSVILQNQGTESVVTIEGIYVGTWAEMLVDMGYDNTKNHVLKVTNGAAGTEIYSKSITYTLASALTSGTEYTVTAKICAPNVTRGTVVKFVLAGGTAKYGDEIAIAANTFHQVSQTFTAANNTGIEIDFGYANGVVYIDDVSCVAKGSSTNLVANSDFEVPLSTEGWSVASWNGQTFTQAEQSLGEVSTQKYQKVHIGAAGWATMVAYNPLSVPADVETYFAKYDSEKGNVKLTTVTNMYQWGRAVIKGDEGDYYFPQIAAGDVTADGVYNGMEISWGSVTGDGSTIYALGKKSGVVGFYLVATGQTIPSGKPYLPIASSAREFIGFGFADDDVTAINSAKSQKQIANGQYFDLQGRKVAQPTRGLYIVNGKKVVIK